MDFQSRPAIEQIELADKHIFAQALWICAFSALTAIGAQVEIPHYPVPFTLQTFFVLLAGAFLGARNGALSQVLYIALGVIGLPVFSGAGFGFARLIGPTGGYLLAFPIAAALVGYMIQRRGSFGWIVVSMVAGLIVIFTSGTLQLYATTIRSLPEAISSGFLILSWWDVLKLGAAATIYHQFAKKWPKLPRG